jgi:2'-5' RNA ligase
MPYAVTLRLDEEAAIPVERIWRALAEQLGDDDAIRLSYAPHITLAVLTDSVEAGEIERVVFGLVDAWEALPVVLAGLGIFPGQPPVIWAAVTVTELLLARHGALCAALAPHVIDPHYRPGSWVPHVTLSQHGRSSASLAIDIATSAWHGPIIGKVDKIDLVKFHPARILHSEVLRS